MRRISLNTANHPKYDALPFFSSNIGILNTDWKWGQLFFCETISFMPSTSTYVSMGCFDPSPTILLYASPLIFGFSTPTSQYFFSPDLPDPVPYTFLSVANTYPAISCPSWITS